MATTTRALAFASRWFDDATVRRTFEPLIADWQREWQDAHPSHRRWISIRGLAAFVLAVIASSPQIARTAAPREVTNRIATRMTGIIAILVALLMIPPSVQFWLLWRADASWMRSATFLFTVPTVLAMAFPFAVMGGVDAIRRHDSLPRHVARASALKLALFAALFMLAYGGWVIPAASQVSVRVMNPPGMGAPLLGMRDLTTTELVFDPARATMFAPGTHLASRSASIQRELNGRASMIVMPMVLLWLRWRAYERTSSWPLTAWFAIPIAIAVVSTAVTSGAWLEREWHLWDGSRSWMPIVVFAMWGMLSSYGRRFLPART